MPALHLSTGKLSLNCSRDSRNDTNELNANNILYAVSFLTHKNIEKHFKLRIIEMCTDLLFWYHVFTCVSVKLNFAANSILSWTLRYFCLSKLFSNVCSWRSVNAVLAFLCFLFIVPPDDFDEFKESSPPWPVKKRTVVKYELKKKTRIKHEA